MYIRSFLARVQSRRGDKPEIRILAHFEQLSEFERGRIIGLKEEGLGNRRITHHKGQSDAAIRRCWVEWMDKGRFQHYEGTG
ncbi:HTH_Tnp_Tc3_2 domain-containing protein [Trichonephila clavipes]|nr:HTH_Tnp_Tc3_2 domain-containing protein [Trichonephila clavipes]